MRDYRVIIRVKNNLLHEHMLRVGIKSHAELARKAGVSKGYISAVANLKVGAFNVDGNLSKGAAGLCDFFACFPEELFPPEVIAIGLPKNVVETIVGSHEVANYLAMQEADPAYVLEQSIDSKCAEYVQEQLADLTEPEQFVVTGVFFENKTQSEVAKELGVTAQRARHILNSALRKLRLKLAAPAPTLHEPLIEDASFQGLFEEFHNRIELGKERKKETEKFKNQHLWNWNQRGQDDEAIV